MPKKRIGIFASGRGSNTAAILNYFKDKDFVEVALILSNDKDAGVLDLAQEHAIRSYIVDRKSFYRSSSIEDLLKELSLDLIVLAGFLWLIPESLIKLYPQKIINIHPALLPKYGGKGMYGMNVHKAVKQAGEKQSGITIHFVNNAFDKGAHIFQATCELTERDSAEIIAVKVLKLEHYHFPRVIERILLPNT